MRGKFLLYQPNLKAYKTVQDLGIFHYADPITVGDLAALNGQCYRVESMMLVWDEPFDVQVGVVAVDD